MWCLLVNDNLNALLAIHVCVCVCSVNLDLLFGSNLSSMHQAHYITSPSLLPGYPQSVQFFSTTTMQPLVHPMMGFSQLPHAALPALPVHSALPLHYVPTYVEPNQQQLLYFYLHQPHGSQLPVQQPQPLHGYAAPPPAWPIQASSPSAIQSMSAYSVTKNAFVSPSHSGIPVGVGAESQRSKGTSRFAKEETKKKKSASSGRHLGRKETRTSMSRSLHVTDSDAKAIVTPLPSSSSTTDPPSPSSLLPLSASSSSSPRTREQVDDGTSETRKSKGVTKEKKKTLLSHSLCESLPSLPSVSSPSPSPSPSPRRPTQQQKISKSVAVPVDDDDEKKAHIATTNLPLALPNITGTKDQQLDWVGLYAALYVEQQPRRFPPKEYARVLVQKDTTLAGLRAEDAFDDKLAQLRDFPSLVAPNYIHNLGKGADTATIGKSAENDFLIFSRRCMMIAEVKYRSDAAGIREAGAQASGVHKHREAFMQWIHEDPGRKKLWGTHSYKGIAIVVLPLVDIGKAETVRTNVDGSKIQVYTKTRLQAILGKEFDLRHVITASLWRDSSALGRHLRELAGSPSSLGDTTDLNHDQIVLLAEYANKLFVGRYITPAVIKRIQDDESYASLVQQLLVSIESKRGCEQQQQYSLSASPVVPSSQQLPSRSPVPSPSSVSSSTVPSHKVIRMVEVTGSAGTGKSVVGLMHAHDILCRDPTAIVLYMMDPEHTRVRLPTLTLRNRVITDELFGNASPGKRNRLIVLPSPSSRMNVEIIEAELKKRRSESKKRSESTIHIIWDEAQDMFRFPIGLQWMSDFILRNVSAVQSVWFLYDPNQAEPECYQQGSEYFRFVHTSQYT